MPLFQYEARNVQGVVLKGKLEAADEASVINSLKQKNYFPVRIKLYKEGLDVDLSKYRKVSVKDIAIFCRQFSFINSAGISILRALEIVKSQTENRKLRGILSEVFEDVQKGKALSAALDRFRDIPKMLINMIEVGEASGTLDKIMDRMATYYETDFKQRQKVKQAMTYPMFISIFAVIVVIILVTKVLPSFIGMLNSTGSTQELPLPTRIVMGLSHALVTKGYLILAVIIIIVVALKFYFKGEAAKSGLDRAKLRVPIFGKIYRKVITARFARTFGNLMASGVPLIQSITICSTIVGNEHVKSILLSCSDELKKGLGLGDTLETRKIFPPMLTQMIKIGEESGTLDNVLERTAEFYDSEVETATSQLTSMIEPLIIVGLAVVVGFIIISIIMPMFQMYNSVQM